MKVDKTKWENTTLEKLCTHGSSDIVISKTKIGNGNYKLYGASGYIGNIDFYHNDKPYLGLIKDGSGVGRVDKYPAYSSLVGTMQYLYPSDNVDIDFLKYLIVHLNLAKYIKGAAIPHIYYRHYKNEKVKVPQSITEQRAIATELDAVQKMIEGYKAQLADLDALAQSIFLDMFGDPITNEKWELKELGNICEITSSKRIFANEYVNEGIPFYRIKEIIEKSHQKPLSIELYISNDRYNAIKEQFGVPQINDLLVTAVGSIGEIWIVNTNNPFYFKDGNIIWIKTSSRINAKYLKYILSSKISYLKKRLANGSAYSALTIIKLKRLSIPVPPLPLQQQFAERVESIERQKELLQAQLAEAQTLMAERMQYYFD